MALDDILTYAGIECLYEQSRGNIGTLSDITGASRDEFAIPQGGGVGAVFPTTGNVDFGITYGPTGTDYTGTLVQPVIADVKSGVQYGANGNEFTGTLVASGGGEQYLIIE